MERKMNMEKRIQSFTNSEFGELEILQEGDKFWFPATECARILGYANPYDAIKKHCREYGLAKREGIFLRQNKDGKTMEMAKTANYISEGNLYRLICRSKLESAERFERWVFDDVLPSIRKYGAYIVPEVVDMVRSSNEKAEELIASLAEERLAKIQLLDEKTHLQNTIEEARPKVSYYDMILQNPNTMPVTLIAKDYGFSAAHFNIILKKFGIQYKVGKTWALYQDYADEGYTHYTVYHIGSKAVSHMVWTQKGRLFLYNFLKRKGIIPMIEKQGMQMRMEEKINGESNIQED